MIQTRRKRIRQMTLDEIKSLSWQTISEKGVERLTVNGIARQMGMTPPAFYRYYKNRDDLIRTLVIDAYQSFTTVIEAAKSAERTPVGQLLNMYRAYREWAVGAPGMFALFAGKPVYGVAPRDSAVTAEAEKVYRLFAGVYRDAWHGGMMSLPETDVTRPEAYMTALETLGRERFGGVPPDLIDLCITGACQIHGMISMELSGRLREFTGDSAAFYDYQIKALLVRQGLDPLQLAQP